MSLRPSPLLIILLLVIQGLAIQGQDLVLPQPYGGPAALRSLLSSEMHYPLAELQQKVKGKVVLRFFVSREGTLQRIRVESGLSGALDAEALRLLRLIRWEPALYQGQPIEKDHLLTLHFHPGQYHRIVRSRGYDAPPFPYLPFDTSVYIFPLERTTTSPSPVYPGGCLSMRDFILKNMSYPPAALKLGISGNVEVQLVVEPSGRSSNVRVIRGIGGGCDEEAQRLVSLLHWVPATVEGRYVRCEMRINITFALPEGSDYRYFPTHQGTSVQ